MKLFLFLFTLPLIFSSCVELVSDEFPEYDAIPALNCILVAGDSIQLQLSLAEQIISSDLTLVDQASVRFSQGETENFFLRNQGNGLYTSGENAAYSVPYKVSVIIDNYPELISYDKVPEPGTVSILSQTNTARLNEDGLYMSGLELTFQDDARTQDYYEILIYKRRDDYIFPAPAFDEQSKILLNEGFEPFTTESLVFSDELFDSESIHLNLIYGQDYNRGSSNGIWHQEIEEYMLIAELRHVSKAYYTFKKSVYFYENSRYSEFIEGTASVYPVYSNIENGLGIFASYSSSLDSVFVEEEIIPLSK